LGLGQQRQRVLALARGRGAPCRRRACTVSAPTSVVFSRTAARSTRWPPVSRVQPQHGAQRGVDVLEGLPVGAGYRRRTTGSCRRGARRRARRWRWRG
jgi:hypothetical protein